VRACAGAQESTTDGGNAPQPTGREEYFLFPKAAQLSRAERDQALRSSDRR
jgi:hypothetical protein